MNRQEILLLDLIGRIEYRVGEFNPMLSINSIGKNHGEEVCGNE